MPDLLESYFPANYREARKNFLSAAMHAGIDAISRVHPSRRGPDGKPLFLDSAALGPRNARTAMLLCAGDIFGSGIQTGLLRENIGARLPPGIRLVMAHARDPVLFACGTAADDDWPQAALGAVVTEDLSRVARLHIIDLESGPGPVRIIRQTGKRALAAALPKARLTAAILTGGTGDKDWKTSLFQAAAAIVRAQIAAL